MVSDWQEVSVDDIKGPSPNSLATGPFGSSISSRFFLDRGVPIIRGSNLSEDVGVRLLSNDLAFISEEKAREFERSTAKLGDLVFTCWGTVGQVGLIDERAPFPKYVVSNKQMKFSPDPAKADSLFLYYLFESPQMSQLIKAVAIGSSVPGFNLGQLRSLRFRIPPLAEQRAIARILGTLDDKIELNRRMNETLEAIARAIFKSWFVDFDPVRAKAEARQPFCMDAKTAALFPCHLVETQQGEVPEGWRLSMLGNAVVTVLGGTPSRAEPSYWGGDVPWINSGKANEFRIVEPSELITEEGLASSATKMLPARTTVIAITGATLGQVSLTEVQTCANQSIVGVIGSVALPSEFVYFWVKEHIGDLLAWQTGGAQQHINKNNVNDLPVLCPDKRVIQAYIALARPMFDQIKVNCLQNLTIAGIRDALLPKLISGEVRMPRAAEVVGGSNG